MEIFERILGIILPVFATIGIGYAYAWLRGGGVKADMSAVNRVSTEVLCPFLVFTALAGKVASIVLLGNLAALVFVPIGLWAGMH